MNKDMRNRIHADVLLSTIEGLDEEECNQIDFDFAVALTNLIMSGAPFTNLDKDGEIDMTKTNQYISAMLHEVRCNLLEAYDKL